MRPSPPAWIPEVLQASGPRGLALWQWIGLVALVAVAWIGGRVLGWATRSVLGRIAKRTKTPWDDAIVARIQGPLGLAWAAGTFWLLLPLLALSARASAIAAKGLRTLVFAAFFWGLVRTVDVASRLLGKSRWAKEHPGARSLFPVASRAANVVVLAVAVTAVVSQLGFPIASLVAGLGLGGIGLALAAQKTFENMFGAFSIGVDQPFVEGDVVRVDDVVATVESIGLRSTRLRTADRSVVTYPNGKLAETKVESLSARDRLRFGSTILLARTTSSAQIRAVLSGFDAALRARPKVWPEGIAVRLEAFTDKGPAIAAAAWFETTDVHELAAIREETLLAFLEVMEKSKVALGGP